MAIDEALLLSCANGGPSTIRLYQWEKPSVSIGYFQSLEGIDVKFCKEHGIDIVRRPTGGRAVLHGHDLTFSITLCEDDLPEEFRGIRRSHAYLMQGIRTALASLGIQAEIGISRKVKGYPKLLPADCFAHVADCDIHVNGFKIVGAAQVRKNGVLLEQGSIPCTEPMVDYQHIFFSNKASRSINPVCSTQSKISYDSLTQAIMQNFPKTLNIELEAGTIESYELETAWELESQKYLKDEWTLNRKDNT